LIINQNIKENKILILLNLNYKYILVLTNLIINFFPSGFSILILAIFIITVINVNIINELKFYTLNLK